MKVRPLDAALGAEVTDLDLNGAVDDVARSDIRAALAKHQVLCFRDQSFTPATLATAAEHFGKAKTFLLEKDHIDGVPQVSIVSNRPPGHVGKPVVQASYWHTDDSYLKLPATLTLLYAVTLPESGGDTEFINCYDVLATLPEPLRAQVSELSAVHRYNSRRSGSWVAPRSAAEEAASPPVTHPLIREHPLTKRLSLYINPNRISHIDGWDDERRDEGLRLATLRRASARSATPRNGGVSPRGAASISTCAMDGSQPCPRLHPRAASTTQLRWLP